MTSHRQNRTHDAWRTTRLAALLPALAVLLAALVICLGALTHATSDPAATPTTTLSVTMQSAGHHSSAIAHPADCPAGDMCCTPGAHGVHAVLAAPVQPLPVLLPRTPDLPRPPDSTPCHTKPPPTAGAPDLHVLQVQRT
ncbi:hypothetical protein [Streptomyces pseudovenezuelae]|uniref:hypothetical protein n=1 Tax=Streptomyces pseudovenezuelae TaxID=67350 RepID=UPI002E31F1A9|nr:hypothetical protein [Streptomyces pseudovenezuelae]